MIIVELQNIIMHAYHGIYEGEAKIGSDYEVNLKVSYNEGKSDFSSINSTINYAEIFEIVQQRMKVPTPLLEKVAEGIIRKIKHQYSFAKEIVISIYKLQPPIEIFQGKVGITMHKTFDV